MLLAADSQAHEILEAVMDGATSGIGKTLGPNPRSVGYQLCSLGSSCRVSVCLSLLVCKAGVAAVALVRWVGRAK